MKYKIDKVDNLFYPYYKSRVGFFKYEWKSFGNTVKFKKYENALKFIDILEFGRKVSFLNTTLAKQLMDGYTTLLLIKDE